MRLITATALVMFISLTSASAQETYSAGQMWGTQPSGVAVTGAFESSVAHTQNGIIAGQANAAREGFLLGTGDGSSLTIQSIGSQSIITSNINGNDISSSLNGTQTSSNSGDVDNQGTINSN